MSLFITVWVSGRENNDKHLTFWISGYSWTFFSICVLQEVYHEKHIQKFWEENKDVFHSFKVVGPEENLSQGEARDMGM